MPPTSVLFSDEDIRNDSTSNIAKTSKASTAVVVKSSYLFTCRTSQGKYARNYDGVCITYMKTADENVSAVDVFGL